MVARIRWYPAGEHRTALVLHLAKFRQVVAHLQRGGAEITGSPARRPRTRRNSDWRRGVFSCGAEHRATEEMTMTKFLALLAATLLAFAAQAGDNKDKPHDTGMKSTATFDALDKNADSQISKTEASADRKLSDNFAALDTNGDGYLSKAEFMARGKT
jgi:EF hand domain-containing protein